MLRMGQNEVLESWAGGGLSSRPQMLLAQTQMSRAIWHAFLYPFHVPLQKSTGLLQSMSYVSDSLGDLRGLKMSTLGQPNQGWWYKTPWQQYKLGTDGLGSSFAEKALGALGDSKLNTRQQRASRVQGRISRSTDSRSREGIIPDFTQHSLDCSNNSAGSFGPP